MLGPPGGRGALKPGMSNHIYDRHVSIYSSLKKQEVASILFTYEL